MQEIKGFKLTFSASLTLGYDIAHQRIEDLLQKAARHTGLTEAFVHITELGDFSVGYKISGFLTETKQLLSARSKWQEKHDELAKKLEELKKGNDDAWQTQVKLIEEEMTRLKQKMEAYLQAQKIDEDQGGKV